ncbi:hypothetical protein HDU99_002934, partial [Rhizoclosmatium hyalinum]
MAAIAAMVGAKTGKTIIKIDNASVVQDGQELVETGGFITARKLMEKSCITQVTIMAQLIQDLLKEGRQIEFEKVTGHSKTEGDDKEGNDKADTNANKGRTAETMTINLEHQSILRFMVATENTTIEGQTWQSLKEIDKLEAY